MIQLIFYILTSICIRKLKYATLYICYVFGKKLFRYFCYLKIDESRKHIRKSC